MSLRNLLRNVFLCIAVGGNSVFCLGMSQEKIKELLQARHQTRVELSISDDESPCDSNVFMLKQLKEK